MTTVAAPRRRYLPDFDLPTPGWVDRQPDLADRRRRRAVDDGAVGVPAHALSERAVLDGRGAVGRDLLALAAAIPGVLRHDGSPPLYYMLLHVWMSVVGNSESQTHALSLLFGLLTVPVGTWIAWSLFGRRAGLIAAVLFAMNPFLTAYSQETRMYTLMSLLGLLATAGIIQGFIYRRRKYLILFAVCQALMLYTHAWGIFFGVGAALALIPVWAVSDDRRGLVRDAIFSFGAAGDPVPAVGADAALPGLAHRLSVGYSPELRRAGPDLPQPDGRRPRDDRAGAGRGDRPRQPVGAQPPYLTRGDGDVGDDAHPDRHARVRMDPLAVLAGLAVPLLRPDPRRAAAAGRVRAWRAPRASV